MKYIAIAGIWIGTGLISIALSMMGLDVVFLSIPFAIFITFIVLYEENKND